jgi:hypothetical protein
MGFRKHTANHLCDNKPFSRTNAHGFHLVNEHGSIQLMWDVASWKIRSKLSACMGVTLLANEFAER